MSEEGAPIREIHRDNNDVVVTTPGDEKDLRFGKQYKVIHKPAGYWDDKHLLTVAFQDGAVQENGVNGVSNEALIAIVRDRINNQNKKLHSTYNEHALDGLEKALKMLEERTRDRQQRGVEGHEQP